MFAFVAGNASGISRGSRCLFFRRLSGSAGLTEAALTDALGTH